MKMKVSLLSWLVLSASVPAQAAPDPLELYRQGRFQEAARGFRKALEAEPLDARLNYNLALTLWRLGEGDDAETKAEIAATLGLDTLRDGILGNLRFQEALAKAEAGDLKTALDLMAKARKHYQRGALRRRSGPALARNLERAIRKEEELRKKREEQKKKEDEQKKKEDKNKDKDQDKQDQDKDQDKKGQDKKQKNQRQQKQKHKRPRLGKPDPLKELTPEQKKRLLERLKQIEAQLRELRKQQKARRPKVKKDW